MKISKLLIFFFTICSFVTLRSQDIHFSQFYMSPLNLNPALTGVMDCNIRLVANYRNQWGSVLGSDAYNTYSFSYDQKIPVGRYDNFAFGATFWNDVAGSADFSTLTAKGSLAYHKQMGGSRSSAHYLIAGAELGIAQRSLDYIKLRWPSQHNGEGGFDPGLESGETNIDPNIVFADFGAGVLWYSVWDKLNSFYIGAAFHHLNQVNVSNYTDGEDILYSQFTAHTGAELMVNKKFGLVPGVVVMMQGPHFQVNSGLGLKFLLGNPREYQAFSIGVWNRIASKANLIDPTSGEIDEDTSPHMDALILSTRFDYQNFSIGFSYDINVSELAPASNNSGGPEFSLIYKICQPNNRKSFCPRF